jgi:hypothetical protein
MEVVNRWRASNFERPFVRYELENLSDQSDAAGATAD